MEFALISIDVSASLDIEDLYARRPFVQEVKLVMGMGRYPLLYLIIFE
jgi:hypothetical protein